MIERDNIQEKLTPPSRDTVRDKATKQAHEAPPAPVQKTEAGKDEESIDDLFDNMPV